jgi:periplasmic divalent cation tolerance protein
MMAAARDFTLVFVMAANEGESGRIAQALVEEKLAACVNIMGPVHSTYRWRGTIETASEYMLLIKAPMRHFSQLERRVRELHSYDVPEIVAVALTAGSRPYVAWMAESTAVARPSASPRSRRRSVRISREVKKQRT